METPSGGVLKSLLDGSTDPEHAHIIQAMHGLMHFTDSILSPCLHTWHNKIYYLDCSEHHAFALYATFIDPKHQNYKIHLIKYESRS